MNNSDIKYYTAFVYMNHNVHDLHCTHKYLGSLESRQITQVIDTIDAFYPDDFIQPVIDFTEREMFGEFLNVPVLTVPQDSMCNLFFKAFTPLRESLSTFRQDDYLFYKPHVTTNLDHVIQPFAGYALVMCLGEDSPDHIIGFWSFLGKPTEDGEINET